MNLDADGRYRSIFYILWYSIDNDILGVDHVYATDEANAIDLFYEAIHVFGYNEHTIKVIKTDPITAEGIITSDSILNYKILSRAKDIIDRATGNNIIQFPTKKRREDS
jgi:hypothetical protein